MPVAAAVAAAVVGGAASIYGANKQASAAKAARIQQQQMFDTTQANIAPFRQAGQAALNPLQSLLGMGPQGSAGIENTLENLPGFKFTRDMALQATQNAQSATGRGWSGPQAYALQQTASGLASQNYNNYFNQLLGTSELGANAAAGQASNAQNFSNQISGSIYGQGNALAAGAVGAGNAIGNAGQTYMLNQLLQNQQGGGGGLSGYLGKSIFG